jgi:hypothetical protein
MNCHRSHWTLVKMLSTGPYSWLIKNFLLLVAFCCVQVESDAERRLGEDEADKKGTPLVSEEGIHDEALNESFCQL